MASNITLREIENIRPTAGRRVRGGAVVSGGKHVIIGQPRKVEREDA